MLASIGHLFCQVIAVLLRQLLRRVFPGTFDFTFGLRQDSNEMSAAFLLNEFRIEGSTISAIVTVAGKRQN